MTTKKIELLDGTFVDINTRISLMAMRNAQKEGLFSKDYLQKMILADSDPSKMNFEDMENAPFVAYRNANPQGMTRDEFNDVLPNDMELFGTIYTEIIQGEAKKGSMAQGFKQVTKKK